MCKYGRDLKYCNATTIVRSHFGSTQCLHGGLPRGKAAQVSGRSAARGLLRCCLPCWCSQNTPARCVSGSRPARRGNRWPTRLGACPNHTQRRLRMRLKRPPCSGRQRFAHPRSRRRTRIPIGTLRSHVCLRMSTRVTARPLWRRRCLRTRIKHSLRCTTRPACMAKAKGRPLPGTTASVHLACAMPLPFSCFAHRWHAWRAIVCWGLWRIMPLCARKLPGKRQSTALQMMKATPAGRCSRGCLRGRATQQGSRALPKPFWCMWMWVLHSVGTSLCA